MRAARTVRALALALVAATTPAALRAHHGVAAYDMATVRTQSGVVATWEWRSPHVWLTLGAPREGGGADVWQIEGAPPGWMSRQGFERSSLTAGERVTITYHPHRQAPFAGILMEIRRADGAVLKVNRPASLGGP